MSGSVWILNEISLDFVPGGAIDTKESLVQLLLSPTLDVLCHDDAKMRH